MAGLAERLGVGWVVVVRPKQGGEIGGGMVGGRMVGGMVGGCRAEDEAVASKRLPTIDLQPSENFDQV